MNQHITVVNHSTGLHKLAYKATRNLAMSTKRNRQLVQEIRAPVVSDKNLALVSSLHASHDILHLIPSADSDVA